MGQDHAKEQEDLEQLLAEPGWARLQDYVAREWGPEAYRRQITRALSGIPAGAEADATATATVFQIEAATRAVELLMGWPRERLAKLRAAREAAAGRTTAWPRGGPA